MTLDAHLSQTPALEAGAPAPLWTTFTALWSPAAQAGAEAELGYESALPWTLAEAAAAEMRPLPY